MAMQPLNITARVKIDVSLVTMMMVKTVMQTLNMTARTKID